ncbi:Thoeris anti-defense Tad2 family protein [Xenorhabdus stockiae]|uniref:Thoeris anti-defense Tad2 family protein n=1 Tax=Xenorhabdus stockiae TaxID=351614 RepID=UPI003CEE5EA8
MSEVNKLDNKQCPFDPEQYKIDTLAAPVGTSPWALIQVYLGNKVHRKDWSAPDEYIHLVPGSGGDAPEIRKRDKHGVMTSWQPTQEDLMACDWHLMKSSSKPQPTDCMLSFNLVVGTGSFSNQDQMWGYLADAEFEPAGEHLGPFGTLSGLQNKTAITTFAFLVWDGLHQKIFIRVSSDNNQTGYQKLVDLFKQNLTITVDGTPYQLGSSTDSHLYGKHEYEFIGEYGNDDAKKLGSLLQQQNDGDSLPYCFIWK